MDLSYYLLHIYYKIKNKKPIIEYTFLPLSHSPLLSLISLSLGFFLPSARFCVVYNGVQNRPVENQRKLYSSILRAEPVQHSFLEQRYNCDSFRVLNTRLSFKVYFTCNDTRQPVFQRIYKKTFSQIFLFLLVDFKIFQKSKIVEANLLKFDQPYEVLQNYSV